MVSVVKGGEAEQRQWLLISLHDGAIRDEHGLRYVATLGRLRRNQVLGTFVDTDHEVVAVQSFGLAVDGHHRPPFIHSLCLNFVDRPVQTIHAAENSAQSKNITYNLLKNAKLFN